MPCPICDQKPINCDCTEAERRMYAEIAELQEQVNRLRLTDAEREAIETAALEAEAHQHAERAATLRGLLERTKRER